MMKLKDILAKFDLSQDELVRLESYFAARLKRKRFIYPQDVINSLQLNPKKASRIFMSLVNQGVLDVYTIPYHERSNYLAEQYAIDHVVFELDEDLDVLDPDTFEPFDHSELKAVAAYRLSNVVP
ncbi:MAG: hypothetical protein WDA09_06440 [Bacteriovoracaceae bacterium]